VFHVEQNAGNAWKWLETNPREAGKISQIRTGNADFLGSPYAEWVIDARDRDVRL
jgi:hypothetical protein